MAKKRSYRLDGQLVQTELDDPAKGLAGQQPALTPPAVTPAGTAASGGSPDQAKMAGTPAQRTAATDTAVSQSRTLAGQERQVGATPAADTGATAAAKATADRLGKLGSLGDRVKALVATRVTNITKPAAPAAPGAAPAPAAVSLKVDPAAVRAAMPGKTDAEIAQAVAALEAYAAGGQKEADLAAVISRVGLPAMTGSQASALFVGAGAQLAQQTTTAQAGPPTLQQLDLAPLGVDQAQLAADLQLTPQQLQAMTVEQLSDAVRAAQNREFSDVEGLRAELRTASPQRAVQIQAQLRQLGESGEAAVEASVQGLADQVEASRLVSFAGGKQVPIGELLKSDAISNQIRDAANDAGKLTELAKTEPGLAAWITENQATLKGLTSTFQTGVQALSGARAEADTALAGVDPGLLKAAGIVAPGEGMTTTELAALKTSLAESPVLQAAQASPEIRELLKAPGGAELASKFTGWTAAQLKAAADQVVAAKADPKLAELLGLTADLAVLIADPKQRKALADAASTWAKVGDAVKRDPAVLGLIKQPSDMAWFTSPKRAKFASEIMAEPWAKDAVTSVLTLRKLADKPGYLAEIRDTVKEQATLRTLIPSLQAGNTASLDEAETLLFGQPMEPDQLSRAYLSINEEIEAARAAGNPAKARQLQERRHGLLSVFDLTGDAIVDAADFTPEMIAKRLSRLSSKDTPASILAKKQADVLTPLSRQRRSTWAEMKSNDWSKYGVKAQTQDAVNAAAAKAKQEMDVSVTQVLGIPAGMADLSLDRSEADWAALQRKPGDSAVLDRWVASLANDGVASYTARLDVLQQQQAQAPTTVRQDYITKLKNRLEIMRAAEKYKNSAKQPTVIADNLGMPTGWGSI